MNVRGYKKKTKEELLKAIEECTSINQLFALVQHEGIVIQMRCSNGGQASNIPSKKLETNQGIMRETPLKKMKREIRDIVLDSCKEEKKEVKKEKPDARKQRLLSAVDRCTTITQLFAIVQHEGLVLPMRCSNGGQASNIPFKQLPKTEEIKKENPVDKMKLDIREMILNMK